MIKKNDSIIDLFAMQELVASARARIPAAPSHESKANGKLLLEALVGPFQWPQMLMLEHTCDHTPALVRMARIGVRACGRARMGCWVGVGGG